MMDGKTQGFRASSIIINKVLIVVLVIACLYGVYGFCKSIDISGLSYLVGIFADAAVIYGAYQTWMATRFVTEFYLGHLELHYNFYKGNFVRVYVENRALRPFSISKVILLSKVDSKVYCTLIAKYDVPIVLQPWQGKVIEQQPFVSVDMPDVVDDCCRNGTIILKDVDDNVLWPNGKRCNKDLVEWFKKNYHGDNTSLRYVHKTFYGCSISDHCKFGAVIYKEADGIKTIQNKLMIYSDGSIYEEDKRVVHIHMERGEVLEKQKVEEVIKYLYIAEGCSNFYVGEIENMRGFSLNGDVFEVLKYSDKLE